MKKLIVTALCSIALLSAATAFEAKVSATKGKTEIQQNGVWKALAPGDVLNKGAVIQTGFKSELTLQMKESVVTVGPLSRMTIEQLAEKQSKDDTRLYLDTGSLKANVKKTENRRVGFTVKSPVATASVRGTIIGVTNTFQATSVSADEGSAAAWPSDNSAPTIATDEEDAAAETPNLTGTTPQDISGGEAPAKSYVVSKGQAADFNESKSTPPEVKASEEAKGMQSGTISVAATEAVAMGSSSDSSTAAVSDTGSTPDIAVTGNLIVNISFK